MSGSLAKSRQLLDVRFGHTFRTWCDIGIESISLVRVIAVTFRENGINLTSLTVEIEPPSWADTDALMLALRALDEMVARQIY